MPKDLTVVLQDRPGELARLGQATGEAGVNLQGMCAFTGEGRGIIHILVDDEKAAVSRLRGHGYEPQEVTFDHYDGSRAAYVTDPDGNVVELWTWDVAVHLR